LDELFRSGLTVNGRATRLKLTNNFKDLPKVLDVGAHLPVKQEEQQGNERNNYKIFQVALCPESAEYRLGLIVAALTFSGRVRQIVATSARKRIAGPATRG
jgi:hypothetical protein